MPELKLGLNDKLLFEASCGNRAQIEHTASHESKELKLFKHSCQFSEPPWITMTKWKQHSKIYLCQLMSNVVYLYAANIIVYNDTLKYTLLHSYMLQYYILQYYVVSAHQMWDQATGRPVAKGKSVEMEAQIVKWRADSSGFSIENWVPIFPITKKWTSNENTSVCSVCSVCKSCQDIKFHQCVQLARFENDRTISFIPSRTQS